MPSVEEQLQQLTAKFTTLETNFEVEKKQNTLKLEAIEKDRNTWKATAEKNAEELVKFQADAEKARKDAAEASLKAKRAEITSFVSDLKKAGRVTPAIENMVTRLMESLTSDATVIKFEEAGGKKVEHTLYTLFKEIMQNLPKGSHALSFTRREQATKEAPKAGAEGEGRQVKIHREGQEITVETQGDDLHEAALQYIEEQKALGRAVSYTDALVAAEKFIQSEAVAA